MCYGWFLKVGGRSHAFYRFASVKPAFLSSLTQARPENILPDTDGVRGVCQESTAMLPTARTAASDAPNGTVIARMCSVESNGRANRAGEQMELRDGQFLMSVVVEGWTWCGCPPQQDGHFLEFTLTVTVPAGYKITEDNKTQGAANVPVKISLGTNDSFILISSKVSK